MNHPLARKIVYIATFSFALAAMLMTLPAAADPRAGSFSKNDLQAMHNLLDDPRVNEQISNVHDHDPYYEEEWFRRLSRETQENVRSANINRDKIDLIQNLVIEKLKYEPSLSTDEVKWLITIEEQYLRSKRMHFAARTSHILGDSSAWKGPTEQWRLKIFKENAIKSSLEASNLHAKAARELKTLIIRLQIRTKE